jgi:uncharacterized C2H2 Zn-finger protein
MHDTYSCEDRFQPKGILYVYNNFNSNQMVKKIKCDNCGKSFHSRKELEKHTEIAHNTYAKNMDVKAIKKDFKISHKSMAIFIGAGFLAAIIGLALGYSGTVSKVSSLTIDGIQCNPSEQLLFHVHAHLDININGQYYLVPAQIGIANACYFWLHTHDVSGIIHIESPVNKDFTLGQFFDIWSKTFNNGQIKFDNHQIFNYVASSSHPLNVYVNGTKVPSTLNYRDIKLHAHDEIAIIYGNVDNKSGLPTTYQFPAGM